ncbi:hypothetical protein O3P69_001933 [Scylla paramamosain]|uniref:Uncharacterized protein n=1 Tax=Scylla paramamosain TaxID=85552 RepID=A0AAW0V2V1_SCYPA
MLCLVFDTTWGWILVPRASCHTSRQSGKPAITEVRCPESGVTALDTKARELPMGLIPEFNTTTGETEEGLEWNSFIGDSIVYKRHQGNPTLQVDQKAGLTHSGMGLCEGVGVVVMVVQGDGRGGGGGE